MWKCELLSGTGKSLLVKLEPPLSDSAPAGGEIRSMLWKVPLKREDWRMFCPPTEPSDELELVTPRLFALSKVFRLVLNGPLPGPCTISTTMFASFVEFGLPLSIALASCAAPSVRKRAMAERNPLSSVMSLGTKSPSMKSLAKSSMLLSASWLVFRGSFLKRIADNTGALAPTPPLSGLTDNGAGGL